MAGPARCARARFAAIKKIKKRFSIPRFGGNLFKATPETPLTDLQNLQAGGVPPFNTLTKNKI